jgi:class 3 adenylate cyclase
VVIDPDSPRRHRKLSAIMMADVSGFSRMMGSDEEATVDLIQDFHRRVALLVEDSEGRVVDTAGDSVFGEFDSVLNAVRCACRIQEEQALVNANRDAGRRVETRIGIHLGDVIVEDYRVYGDGVNIAARLEPLAEPGGICFSEAVYAQVRSKLDLRVEDLGLRELKNIEHPIRLYRVSPAAAPSDGSAPARTESTEPTRKGVAPASVSDGPVREPLRDEVLDPARLIPLSVGALLVTSPILFFSTAGVFPVAGAILISVVAGRIWARRTGQPGRALFALGLGIASGALWTNWSAVTNGLFVLGGMIVAAAGSGRRRRRKEKGSRAR